MDSATFYMFLASKLILLLHETNKAALRAEILSGTFEGNEIVLTGSNFRFYDGCHSSTELLITH